MKKNKMRNFLRISSLLLALMATLTFITSACNNKSGSEKKQLQVERIIYSSAKPVTRWWWFASIIENKDIEEQLNWLKENGFGGVEIAFIYPVNRDPKAERFEWLGPKWQAAVRHTKTYAQHLDLGCDFTFGTLWPFGGTFVPDEDRTRVYGDPNFKQSLSISWTHPVEGNVLDHMNKKAFERYAEVMGKALAPALEGHTSALFCDSWEVETRRIWTDGFSQTFQQRFGYDVEPYMQDIYSKANSDVLYDYMKLVAETVTNNFYIPFTQTCHRLGALSRVQCAGAPVDLITAYANVDIPETEAMLYEPNFSRVVASAAALAGKKIISAETFTCLYGWPRVYHLHEQTADLKLVADALFANGVNQVIWHGMPFSPMDKEPVYFYATVHAGPGGALAPEIPAFNAYMTKVSQAMRRGKTYSRIAMYLPTEDAWIAGEYPQELQMKWSWGAYELRYVYPPDELKGFHPLWINHQFLREGRLQDGLLMCGDTAFSCLYIDVDYLDSAALDTLLDLAGKGFPICLKKLPAEPGKIKSGTYKTRLEKLKAFGNVSDTFTGTAAAAPLVHYSRGNTGNTGNEALPDYWCRVDGDKYYFFFAHPLAHGLKLPLSYGQSYTEKRIELPVEINVMGRSHAVNLVFEPYQSILLEIVPPGEVHFLDITFTPRVPSQNPPES